MKETAVKVFEDIMNIFGHFLPTQPILIQCQNVSPKQLSGSIIGMPQVPPLPPHNLLLCKQSDNVTAR